MAEQTIEADAMSLNAAALKSQADVLSRAARLELGATNVYLGVIPAFGNCELAEVAACLAAEETMRMTGLNNTPGRPPPTGVCPSVPDFAPAAHLLRRRARNLQADSPR